MKYLYALITAFLLSAGCFAMEAPRKLVVIQTTDIHCRISGQTSSWLKLASIIKQEREKAGIDNTLLIDCGDVLQGSFSGAETSGAIALEMLNALHYDIWVPGNHDFNFGLNVLLKYVKQFTGTTLAANLQLLQPSPDIKPWKIFNRAGMKIAVIGFTLPDTEKREWRRHGFKTVMPMKIMPELMQEVAMEKPDLIIVASHTGLYTSGKSMQEIAMRYPEVNLILGGHTHQDIPGERVGRTVWFVQASKHAAGAAVITIQVNHDKAVKISSRIIPVTNETGQDADCLKKLQPALKAINLKKHQVIGQSLNQLSNEGEPHSASSSNELALRAIAAAANAPLAFLSSSKIQLPAGRISRGDAFRIYPYEDVICTLNLNAREVKAIIEDQMKSNRHVLYPFGVKAVISKQGKVIGKLVFDNGTVWEDEDKRIKTAFSSYGLNRIYDKLDQQAGFSEKSGGEKTDILVRNAIYAYIRNNSPLQICSVERIRRGRKAAARKREVVYDAL